MGHGVQFKCYFGENKPLSALSDIIEKRQKYLNETAFQSIHAIAIDVLKSIRGMTKVAKPGTIKVDVAVRADLQVSFYTIQGSAAYLGKRHVPARLCLRDNAGNHVRPAPGVKVSFRSLVGETGSSTKGARVYEFVDQFSKESVRYLIGARSKSDAIHEARMIVASRMLRYAGLARRAISALMVKTNTRGPADQVSARVYAKANEVTDSRNVIATSAKGDGKYALLLDDNLSYAKRAVKGEAATINLALKKAANKSVGLIHKKCGNLLMPGELATPFPDITRKRVA